MLKKLIASFALAFLFTFYSITMSPIYAQTSQVSCGDQFPAEISVTEERHSYTIGMRAGDEISIYVTSVGQSRSPYIYLFDPSSSQVDYNVDSGQTSLTNVVVPATGTYTIQVLDSSERPMAYTIGIGCKLIDGRECEPGVPCAPVNPTSVPPQPSPGPEPIDFGYPGTAPLDFSPVSLTSLVPQLYGVPITSSIPVLGSGISGFSIEAIAGDILEISAQRSAGNLPVGFVVFAEPNIPVFIAGPISSSTFSTEITLPQDGNYVIGLFRMGDVPSNGQDTAFQIRVSLNP